MPKFMNRDEIDEAVRIIAARAPRIWSYAVFLADWRDIVDDNSDGWPYCRQGSAAAGRLMDLLGNSIVAIREGRPHNIPQNVAFDKALAPIRACATRRGLPAPVLRLTEDAPALPGPC